MAHGIGRIFVLLAIVGGTAACHRNPTSTTSPQEVGIEQLLANPKAYDHHLVTVRGCYVSAFERSTLEPCQDARHDTLIWVEDAAPIHALEQLQLPGIRIPEPKELQTAPKPVFVFPYDDTKNREAWRKLIPERLPSVYRSEVTLVGQFETIAPQRPDPMRSGFGHLNAYMHDLILVDVLRSKSF